MKEAGFEVSNKLKVVVDPKLPFMGYSAKRTGDDIIVISSMMLKSGMVEGLLVHEMSHIYRINTNHPSHNHESLNRVGRFIIDKSHLTRAYQIKIIQQAVNHIQDLYADDVALSFQPKQGVSARPSAQFLSRPDKWQTGGFKKRKSRVAERRHNVGQLFCSQQHDKARCAGR
jgi:hypothetical protein